MQSTKAILSYKRILIWVGLLVLFGQLSRASASDIQVDIVARDTTFQPGTTSWIGVKIQIPEGVHIYGANPGSLGLPTNVEWILPKGLHTSPIYWPATEHFSINGQAGDGYQGALVLPAQLTIDADVAISAATEIQAKVSWLACSDACIPGSTIVTLTLPISNQTPIANPLTEDYFERVAPESPEGMPWLTLFLAFIGGILLNLMPCVFPVLGIKILSFVEHSNGSAKKIRIHGQMFTLGVLLSFWTLAAVLIGLRQAGSSLGWGFQLQSPGFILFLMALFFVMGLELMGMFEMGLSLTRVGGRLSSQKGFLSSFMSGVLATLVATPCTGPFMGAALGVALGRSYPIAFGIFTALALGMASPYWLLSMYPKWIQLLPKPGAWMESMKQLMAFPLFATVIWLGWVLGIQTSIGILAQSTFGLLFLAIAVWIWGHWGVFHNPLKTRRWAFGIAALVFALGVWFMVDGLNTAQSKPASSLSQSAADGITWEIWDPVRVKQLHAEGKIVFVDFTAAWCLTCQANKQTTLENDTVVQTFKKLGVVAMEADWTRRDAAITEALASFGRSGVPLNVVYPANPQADPVVLPQILTPSIVIDALHAAANH
ncbi:MAG TPA: protein-disulfide reductase DsbD family protein [Opitutales bacterium]|nr:protein-disulfide reductase DsbD family protein [Opitutales bacterium]